MIGSRHGISANTQAAQPGWPEFGAAAPLLARLPGMAYRATAEPARTLTFASAGVLELTGHSAEAFTSGRARWPELVHPDDANVVADVVATALREGRGFVLVHRIQHAAGAVRWVLDHCELVEEHTGQRAFVGFVSDVTELEDLTERQRAEVTLRETEQWLRRAQEAGRVGLFDGDVAHREARCSDYLFEVVGRAPPASRTIAFDEAAEWIHPDDRARVRAEFAQAIVGTAARVSAELRVLGEDGEPRWISYEGEIQRDAAGRAERVLGAIHDITTPRRSEEALRTAHDRLSLALRAAQAGLWDWDMTRSAEAFVSPEYYDLYGLPQGLPFTYAAWLAYIHPADRARVEAYGNEVFAHGTEYAIEFRINHPTRGVRWLNSAGRVLRDARGRAERFSGINVDITALKQAERAQRDSEQRFRKVFEHAGTGIAITDLEGRLEQCNAAYARLLGYSQDELRHLPFAALIHPDDRAGNLDQVRRLRASELPSFEIENRYLRKDGQELWVHKFVSVLSSETGAPTHLIALVTDTTDRHRAARALQESEARLRSVLDSMFTYVWVVAPDGALIEANAAPIRAIGKTRGELLGTPLWDCAWWTHDEAVRARLRAGFERAARGELVRYEETLRVEADVRSDGRMLVDLQLQPVREPDAAPDRARIRFVIASAVDITDRKRAEDALREADRRKDEFLATLAHELRNPLAPLRTGFDVMKDADDRGTRDRARAMMERQLRHMVRLIDDLLDVSRISRGKLELRCELVPLQVAIQHALETSAPLVAARRHALTTHVPEAPIWINGDLTRLAQVIGNLVNNATKYTPEGGHLNLTVEVEDADAVIRISDDGVGIPHDELSAVFELFSQAARDRGRSQGGLGIGLFLVRRLVELHGGTITAASAGLGKGATFTIRLPRAAPAPAPTPHADAPTPAHARRRILVVDDNEDAAEMLATVLDLHGYETRIAHDGPSALEIARGFTPEVAFLDIGLPGMSGHELAQHLRADPVLANTVLIALTGWGGTEDKQRTAAAGFNFHLTKPVDVAAVEDVLARF